MPRTYADADDWFVRLAAKAYIAIGNTLDVTTGAFARAIDVRTRFSHNTEYILRKFSGGNPGWWAGFAVGCPQFVLLKSGTALVNLTSTTRIDNGEWHEILFDCSVDGAGKRVLRILVDGILVGTSAAVENTTSLTNAETCYISNSTSGFMGDVRNVRAWDRSVADLRLAGTALEDITDGLQCWLKCDDGRDTGLASDIFNPDAADSVAGKWGRLYLCRYARERRIRPSASSTLLAVRVITDPHVSASLPDNEGNLRLSRIQQALYGGPSYDIALGLGDWIDGVTGDGGISDETDLGTVAQTLTNAQANIGKPIKAQNGNHDYTNLQNGLQQWTEIMAAHVGTVSGAPSPYYSFDVNGVHIVSLSTEWTAAGPAVPGACLAWLEEDLTEHAGKPTLVMSHCRLDQNWPGDRFVIADDAGKQLGQLSLSGLTAANTTLYDLWWNLSRANDLTTLSLYKEAAKTTLVGQGTLAAATGTMTIEAVGGSGITGSVHVDYSADDTGASNKITSGTWTLQSAGYSVFYTNAAAIRALLEQFPDVRWHISGHEHSRHYSVRNGIRYLNFPALSAGLHYSTIYLKAVGEVRCHGMGYGLSFSWR